VADWAGVVRVLSYLVFTDGADRSFMERFDVDAVQAFELLRNRSQDSSTPLHPPAADIVHRGPAHGRDRVAPSKHRAAPEARARCVVVISANKTVKRS
jgi:hypothetical protein